MTLKGGRQSFPFAHARWKESFFSQHLPGPYSKGVAVGVGPPVGRTVAVDVATGVAAAVGAKVATIGATFGRAGTLALVELQATTLRRPPVITTSDPATAQSPKRTNP